MDTEIQKAVEAGKLTQKQGEALDVLTVGTACLHRSWGFGTIADVNLLLNQITIDFVGKSGHPMQLGYAADSLQALAEDHVMVQMAKDPETVRKQAKENPAELVRLILANFGGSATQEKIMEILTGPVFTVDQCKKWWPTAKKHLKKDGHINVPTKRTAPLTLREEAVTRADELIAAFTDTNRLKERIAALNEILKHLSDFDDPAAQLQPVVDELEVLAQKNQRLHPAETVEFLLGRDELCKKFDVLKRKEDSLQLVNLLHQFGNSLGEVLEQIPATRQKGFLAAVETAFDDEWTDVALGLMHTGSLRIANEVGRFMVDRGRKDELRAALGTWITERSITSETLYWLCKERKRNFGELFEPELVGAILSSLERDQFNEKKSNKLQDLILADKTLVGDLLDGADIDSAREVMRRLMLTPVFEELSKRSLLARIIKMYPQLQAMLSGDQEEKEEALIVSWSSLAKAKDDLEDLVKKKIPENSHEIGVAREHGDLRENFEFKAAKEMQAVLMRRKAEMERDIGRSRGTDFSDPDTSIVSIGTVVTIRNTDSSEDTYTFLGAWDSAPEKGYLSYLTAIGQGLLGKAVGETVTLPGSESGDREVEIVAIKAFEDIEQFQA